MKKAVIEYIHKLRDEHLIDDYALAGAGALIYYIEPLLTYDLDIFILCSAQGTSIIDMRPFYKVAKKMGYEDNMECIMIDGVPVQLIFAPGDLEVEAVRRAQTKVDGDFGVRVLSLEYLMAIMLKNWRPKDKERLVKIVADGTAYNSVELDSIMVKYNLEDKWEKICDKAK